MKDNALVKISVIMSVYNCAEYLSDAIESMLNQTFSDWELLICNDGSTDETYTVAKQYKTKYSQKIRLMQLNHNCKQAVARNKCLERARGEYIAVMDGDDTCDPKKLELEYQFLEKHPEVDFVGTGMTFFDEHGVWGRSIPKEYPATEDYVKRMPFCAATCLYRKAALDAVGGYREGKRYWRLEDVDLLVRLHASGFRGMNIQEPLYNYREYKDTIKRRTLVGRIKVVRYNMEVIKMCGLPFWMNLYSLRPILLGLLPHKAYVILHRVKYRVK